MRELADAPVIAAAHSCGSSDGLIYGNVLHCPRGCLLDPYCAKFWTRRTKTAQAVSDSLP